MVYCHVPRWLWKKNGATGWFRNGRRAVAAVAATKQKVVDSFPNGALASIFLMDNIQTGSPTCDLPWTTKSVALRAAPCQVDAAINHYIEAVAG